MCYALNSFIFEAIKKHTIFLKKSEKKGLQLEW
nr:MAG TPA: hypothetical protein [Caudoviricetes sp.]